MVNFITITPYQYTYLNFLNGSSEFRYKKFENDYWGLSIKELVDKTKKFEKGVVNISTCGLNDLNLKKFLKRRPEINYKIVSPDESTYIVMTNRILIYDGTKTCFDKYLGDEIVSVKRNGLVLSTIRKIN